MSPHAAQWLGRIRGILDHQPGESIRTLPVDTNVPSATCGEGTTDAPNSTMIAPMRPERRKLLLPQLAIVWILGLTAMAPAAQPPESSNDPDVVFNQAVRDFFLGNIKKSADGFDQLVKLAPSAIPRLWQRGIVLYYAGRYEDCRKQFESHRTYNPNDVENAAWHFLCVALLESPEQAKLELLPVGPDSRRPMQEVYGLFAGELTANEVLAATQGELSAEFFANLYLGLHAEALGNSQAAINYLQTAADDKYARVGGYMHMVARVHLSLQTVSR